MSSTLYALQTARREAQLAEQTARSLSSQAQSAQRSADQEQARADRLALRASDADDRSTAARRNVATAETAQGVRVEPQRAAPFINTSGQSTGVLLNVVA
jgi:multidrug resistance efflux pump